jgi:hypothetical protein
LKNFDELLMDSRVLTGLWLKRREELENPLGRVAPLQPPARAGPSGQLAAGPADLVVEIGCEELPPSEAVSAANQLRCRAHALSEMENLRTSVYSALRIVRNDTQPQITIPRQPSNFLKP